MNNLLTSYAIRNTYIRLLIDKFINVSSKQKNEIIPKQITDDSNEYIEDSNPVLGFVMDNYVITNNDTDRIQSSELFNEFKSKNYGSKMTSAKFKDDIVNIGGIVHKRFKTGIYFTGLKLKEPN